jgi:hypothetical protein
VRKKHCYHPTTHLPTCGMAPTSKDQSRCSVYPRVILSNHALTIPERSSVLPWPSLIPLRWAGLAASVAAEAGEASLSLRVFWNSGEEDERSSSTGVTLSTRALGLTFITHKSYTCLSIAPLMGRPVSEEGGDTLLALRRL